jgi:hypothetical protein
LIHEFNDVPCSLLMGNYSCLFSSAGAQDVFARCLTPAIASSTTSTRTEAKK